MTTRTVPATEQRSLAERFHISSSAVLVGIIVVEIIFFSAVQPAFLTATNLLNAARASSVMGIVAIGVTFGLISGAVDLSVASVLALSGVVGHTLLTSGVPGPIAVAGALVTGALFGLFNGIVTVRFRVNSLITTIGTLTIARGLAFGIADDAAPRSHDAFFNLFQTRLLGVPLAVLACGLLFLAGWYVLWYTRFGRYAYAIGWKGLVIAEVFGSDRGMGWTIKFWYDAHRAHGVIGFALFFVFFALVLEKLVFERLSKKAFKWRPQVGGVEMVEESFLIDQTIGGAGENPVTIEGGIRG